MNVIEVNCKCNFVKKFVLQFLEAYRIKSLDEKNHYMLLQNVEKLAQLYASPDDVEVIVGGSLEEHVPDTLTGPTFLCIFIEQFYRTRVGDRYWFERGDHELAFTIGKYPIKLDFNFDLNC